MDARLDDQAIAAKVAALPGWVYERGWLRREYKTDGWAQTLLVVNAIAFLSEAAYHHPDLAVTWARVEVKLMTHSAGGITDKDFELARRLDALVLWTPDPGAALTGPPNPLARASVRPA